MTGIHSKAATKEYRDNHSRIFGLTPMERKWLEEEEAAAECEHESFNTETGCCAICGFNFAPLPATCECAEAVCHVPEDVASKCLIGGTDIPYDTEDMMPVEDP